MNREGRIGQQKKGEPFKLYVNSQDDYILIDENDATIFDRYTNFVNWLDSKISEIQDTEKQLNERYQGEIIRKDEDGNVTDVNIKAFSELSALRLSTYSSIRDQIEIVFGQDLCRKFFRASYEINPDFVPDDECIYDLLEAITPVLNDLFKGKRERIQLKYSAKRKGGNMQKYRG